MTALLTQEMKDKAVTVQGTIGALDFDTKSGLVYDQGGEPLEGYQRIWRPDTGRTLAIMSKKYQLVQHKEVMAPAIDALGSDGWKVKASRIERGGASAFVELERRDVVTKVVGEKVGERILMRNTYDGTSSLTLNIGAIVLICGNGMVAPGKGSIGFDAHHVGDIRDRLGLLTAKVRKIESGLAERLLESYSEMDKVVPTEIAKEIVKRVMGERKVEKPLEYWRHGIGRDGSATAWNLYNGMTQYLTHDFTGGWSRRERKNHESFELIAGWIKTGVLPKQDPEGN